MVNGKALPVFALSCLFSADLAAGFVASTLLTSAPSHRCCPTHSLSAAKGGGSGGNKGKKKSGKSKGASAAITAQTTKGFGAPPPRLEDVLASFKTRAPDDADDQPCPCGAAGQVYADCCGPLHRGDRRCTTMTDVLRSRYAAFSWRNIGYVIDTTHPECRDYREDRVAWARDLNKGGMFDSFEFVKLAPGAEEMSSDDENEGFIEFKVTMRAKEGKNGSAAGRETVISERSRFLRDPADGSWSYASGDVRSDVAGLEDAMLNP